MKPGRYPTIPIVESQSGRVVGSFCSTLDAVSEEELALMAQIRHLSSQAKDIKIQLNATVSEEERSRLQQRLQELRSLATPLQEQLKQATHEKNVRLGHATLPVDDLASHSSHSHPPSKDRL
ncbi:MAG: hypothetical protein HQL78_07630 [Magnetococcales bacterium]|nr:hypothetical protein [Magnetococcales bacterium]